MDVKIFENALSPNVYSELRGLIFSPRMQWGPVINIALSNNSPEQRYNNYGFGQIIYDVPDHPDMPPVRHETFNIFFMTYLAQLDRLGYKVGEVELLRIRLGLQTHQGSHVIHDPHIDFQYPHRTMLTYFTSEEGSGYTTFYNGKPPNLQVALQNDPKENTCVDFDGLIYHSSSSPMKNAFRYAMNINYRIR